MLQVLVIHEDKAIALPSPYLIAETIKIAKRSEMVVRSGNELMYLSPSYYINLYLEKFENAGYMYIRNAFEKLNIGLIDVSEVEFWDACIQMGKNGIAEKIEIQEDFKDFT